jgi:hypothetical protein
LVGREVVDKIDGEPGVDIEVSVSKGIDATFDGESVIRDVVDKQPATCWT